MKTKMVVSTVGLVLVLHFASCSSRKKETVDTAGMDSAAMLNTASMDDSSNTDDSSAVKVFDKVDVSVKDQLNDFLTDYFSLTAALAKDDQAAAKAAAKKLSARINRFDMSKLNDEQMEFYHEQVAPLTAGLNAINAAKNLDETRIQYSKISQSMYALVKAFHPNSLAIYYQFCPMANNGEGANWLSATKKIENPYEGQRMPTCGSTMETLQ